MTGVLRTMGFFVILALSLGGSALAPIVLWSPLGLQRFRARWVHLVAPVLLKVLGVQVVTRFHSAPPWSPRGARAGMTVSNHISYLDVLVAAAQLPTLFVTSIEMRDEPFVGWICRLAGCVFVERRSPRRLRAEIAELSALLRHGFHVVLFPEATSTRGTGVRPFRRALFEAARDAAVPLWVAQVQYPEGVRMRVSYAEDDAFLPHLRRLLVTHELRAEWTWLSLLEGTEIVSHSSQELASWAHSQIEAQFQPSPLLASAI